MDENTPRPIRFVAKVRAVLQEDWLGRAGRRWRRTVSGLSRFNKEHLQLDDKANEAPELLWNAAEGWAREKHAKAAADYSKAENDRIEATLKRRVLEDKARQERANANKLEAEAVQARIQEIKARVALAKDLEDLGMAIIIENDGTIRAFDQPHRKSGVMKALLTPDDVLALEAALIDVRIPEIDDIAEGKLVRWLRRRGERVESDEPILELKTTAVDTEIPSPAAGTIFELLVAEGAMVRINETIVARIDPDGSKSSSPALNR
jgi:biotin carboxyl carrier protein